MSDAPFAGLLLGWKATKSGLRPNAADSSSKMSKAIAAATLDELGVPSDRESGVADPATGRPLELAVAGALKSELAQAAPDRPFVVLEKPGLVTDFEQYSHLKRVNNAAKKSAELRVTLGTDYLIKPDVVVALPGVGAGALPFLHAVVSCKWTIRSDRVQNIRHEYNQLIRHRRERLPHLMTVTAEPLPTRLVSIARGTGEVDATYHIAFDAMRAAISRLKKLGTLTKEQEIAWDEVVDLGRVRPYSDLAKTIARW
ncbi:NgoMIV family type II restriction endonuclease [Leifsonia sp. NPDC077715]|uniref:NgoMIV family type II restriction endonuclease n=1 Tax=Leifsonia sp. NPDC077715 TaxID=3155539 RepID=UPI0034195C43